jgi:molybdopterin-guanine dinucleotide biosynthesis protein MobB
VRSESPKGELPPALCVVGKKNSGKTTLLVALTAELTRRGWRVATIKHGHHAFESDEPGRDSWRHFNEGGAEGSIMCGTGKVALTLRIPGEPDPEDLIHEFYAGRGFHLILIEGWKHGVLPKLEIFRAAAHADPIRADGTIAVVTDAVDRWPGDLPVFALDDRGAHVSRVCDFIEKAMLHAR